MTNEIKTGAILAKWTIKNVWIRCCHKGHPKSGGYFRCGRLHL